MAYRPVVRNAGWWRRVGAAFIDGIISWVFILPGVIALVAGPTEFTQCTGFETDVCETATAGTVGIDVLL